MKLFAGIVGGAVLMVITGCHSGKSTAENTGERVLEKRPRMVWIPGGEFIMGTDDPESYAHERPAHTVQVSGFWMDEPEVTNEQFKAFTDATKYLTVAER